MGTCCGCALPSPPPSLPLQHVRELPEFAYFMSLDRSKWLRCLLWHGWLPGLSGVSDGDPWASSFGILLSVSLSGVWVLIRLTFLVPGLLLNIGMLTILLWRSWIILKFGLMVAGRISLLSACLMWLVLVYICLLLKLLLIARYGELQKSLVMRLERCRAFLPVPGVMQTVQRAEFWGAIVALQAYWPCHLGIDNLNVARAIGRLLDKDCLVKPLPLVKDGDLVALVQYMIRTRGWETVRVTKVKRHAEDSDVQHCRVRLEDQLGNAEADTAADLGRRHQSEVLIDAWRRLPKVRSNWYPTLLLLHVFMIAVARVTVNHDGRGGTAPDPLVWDQGGPKKKHACLILGSLLILPLFPTLLVS